MHIVAVALASSMVAMATPISSARADGLAPCESEGGFRSELEALIGDPHRGEILVSFTALPSFQPEWGLQIIRSADGFLLRSVQFTRSVWYGAYREVRPGYFARDPDAATPNPIVHEVSISPDLAGALTKTIVAEVAHADSSNSRLGFDGEGFHFYAAGRCASAWSPERGTKPQRLVDIFENLKVQASLPTRLLQLFWEKRVLAKLLKVTGSASMPVSQYLLVAALGVGIVAFGALPLLIASVVMLIPRRLATKRRFVLVSGALSYGFTCFFALVLLPFFLIGSQISAQLGVDGYSSLASITGLITKCSSVALFVSWLVFSVVVPIYLRRAIWPSFANTSQQPAAGDAR